MRIVSVTLASLRLPGAAGRAAGSADSARTAAEAMVRAAGEQRSRLSALARGESDALLAAARSHGGHAAREAEQESARFTALLAAYMEAPDETRERLRRETLTAVLGAVRCLTAEEAERAEGDKTGIVGEHQP